MLDSELGLLSRGKIIQSGTQAVVYETGNPGWVVRESQIYTSEGSLFNVEQESWKRVFEGRANPEKFELTPPEQVALKRHILVPAGIRHVERSGNVYLQSFYPQKTTDLDRYLYYKDERRIIRMRFNDPLVPLTIVNNMLEQIAPAIDALIKLRIYHRDILMVNILIDESTRELSLIDFGRSTLYLGVKNDSEEESYKSMREEFLYRIYDILRSHRLKDRWTLLRDRLERQIDGISSSLPISPRVLSKEAIPELLPLVKCDIEESKQNTTVT